MQGTMLGLVTLDPHTPHRSNIILRRVGIVSNNDIWRIEEWVAVEQGAVRGDRNALGGLVFCLGSRIITGLGTRKSMNTQTILAFRLGDYLINKLPRRA